MYKFIAWVWFINCCLVHCGEPSEADTDYYWKDYYEGHVPSDAIPGGHDKNGNSTYVALVAHSGGKRLIVGTLYPGLHALSYSPLTISHVKYGVTTHTLTILVLCSRHHNRYKWVPTNSKNLEKINSTLVKGGDYPIGRALYQGEMKIGRVFLSDLKYRGLWLAGEINTGRHKRLQDFEILVYDAPCNLCWGG